MVPTLIMVPRAEGPTSNTRGIDHAEQNSIGPSGGKDNSALMALAVKELESLRNRGVDVHFPKIKKQLVDDAMDIFFDVRKIPGLKKKPSTSELVDWLKLIMSDDIPEDILTNRDLTKAIPPLYGALLKNEQDVHLLERLAFMTRREAR